MAIRHFGDLLNDMNRYMCLLSPVVLGALVPLVLFLEDVEKRVVKVWPLGLVPLTLTENYNVSQKSK